MKNRDHLCGMILTVFLLIASVKAQAPLSLSPMNPPPKKVPKTLQDIVTATPFQFPPETIKRMADGSKSVDFAQKADAEASRGDWAKALPDYQQALTLWPGDQIALYGMANFSLTEGDTAASIGYYRRAIYLDSQPPTLPAFQEINAFRLMEYVLLLSQSGQQEEALRVYQQGAHLLNYMDGQPHLKMRLPEFGNGTDQIAFTPKRLQAMAQVGWAYDHVGFDRAGAWQRLQEAVELYPDSPVVYFYRGHYAARYREKGSNAEADFDRAAQLSNPAQKVAVQLERDFFFEPPAKVRAIKSPQ